MHILIAMRRNEQHWLLSDDEAKLYGERLGAVLRHFPIGVTQKWADITAFVVTVGTIEGPRIGQSVRLAQERRTARIREMQSRGAPPGNGATGPVWPSPAGDPLVIQPGLPQ